MDAALAEAEGKAVEEEIQHHADEEAADSSEDDGIGQKKLPAAADVKRRKTKKTAAPEFDTASTAPSSATQLQRTGGGQKRKQQQPEAASHLQNAQARLNALESFNPLTVWQGGVKRREVDKRLSICFNVQSALEDFLETNPEAQRLGEQLTMKAQEVTDWMDCIIPLHNKSDGRLEHVAGMDWSQVGKLNAPLPSDCLHSICVEVGKQMLEDLWWVSRSFDLSGQEPQQILLPVHPDSQD